MANLFPLKKVHVEVGEKKSIVVYAPPPGCRIKEFSRSNECVENWPPELPPGAAGWTLNGIAPGAGRMTCVLDNGDSDWFEYMVGDVPPLEQIKAGTLAIELWETGNRYQAVVSLSDESLEGHEVQNGEVMIIGRMPDGVYFAGLAKLGD